VKDGAQAIEDLGDAIDATVFGLPTGALTLIGTTSFTAALTVTIDNVFTSTYKNYLVILNAAAGSGTFADQALQMRTAGSTNTTSNYSHGVFRVNYSAGTLGAGGTGQTSWPKAGRAENNQPTTSNYVFYNPQVAEKTFVLGQTVDTEMLRSGGSLFNATTQFDGFIFTVDRAITGTISVYGIED
jgi:hypothetical protein